jgi:hypothetical protein
MNATPKQPINQHVLSDLWSGLDNIPLPAAGVGPDPTFLDAQAKATGMVQPSKFAGKKKAKPRTALQKRQSWIKGEETRLANLATKRMEWVAGHMVVFHWLVTHREKSEFARSLLEGLNSYGSLTPGQVAAVERAIVQDEERARIREATLAAAPVLGTHADLLATFNRARGTGLKRPTLRTGDLVFSLAGDASKNPGCIYIKLAGEYQGKITPQGKLAPLYSCTPDTVAAITRVMADPKAAAIAYGKLTGRCSVCGRELTDPVSVAAGIGPICAGGYGW